MCNQLQERFVFYIFNSELGLGVIIFLHLLNYPVLKEPYTALVERKLDGTT